MPTPNDVLGGAKDSVRIEIDDKLIKIAEQYEVTMSVLRQPGAFTLRLGSSQTARDLIAMITPRKSRYKLFVNDVLQQSGIIYGRGVPSSNATVLEIKGRDYMSVVYDAYVREDRSFSEKTYVTLTRKVLDICELTEDKGFRLVTSNDTNRIKLTGRKVTTTTHAADTPAQPKSKATQEKRDAKAKALTPREKNRAARIALEEREGVNADVTSDPNRAGIGQVRTAEGFRAVQSAQGSPSAIVAQRAIESLKTSAAAGTSTVVVQTLKVKLGRRYEEFLSEQYKLAGLFLWSSADGTFVLARPSANQKPAFRLRRGRGIRSNVIEAQFDDDTTNRHTSAIVYGRSGKGKAGRNKLRGEFVDEELKESQFDAPIVVHDDDIKDNQQANYIARKTIAEERRAGWKLTYTVSGHTTVGISSADGESTVWAVDTVVDVDDQELGIQGEFYIETVTFRRNPHTTTELVLMRPTDLLFADNLYPGA